MCTAANCSQVDGAGPEESNYVTRLPRAGGEKPVVQTGEQVAVDPGPIPTGPGADGIHLSFAHSFLYTSGMQQVLNAISDGDVLGPDATAVFGSLESFELFGEDPMMPSDFFVFDRNGAEEIVDATGPGGALFNSELGAEWGRFVLSDYQVTDPDFDFGSGPIEPVSLSWIASNNVPDDADLPMGDVIGTYDEVVGGSLPVYVTCCSEPVVEVGTHEIEIKVNFGTGYLELFRVDAVFPSAEVTLEYTGSSSASIFDGFISFSGSPNNIQLIGGGSPIPIFGQAVFGFAGAGGIGMTGAYSFNTFSAMPAHTGNSSFAVRRTSLVPSSMTPY